MREAAMGISPVILTVGSQVVSWVLNMLDTMSTQPDKHLISLPLY